MKKMRCLIQRENGEVLLPQLSKEQQDINKPQTISGMLNQKLADQKKTKEQKLIDGYWIILQEWSMCTLKCGGGKSYLQRMCVPPKNGGRPCDGEAIMTKDCNKQPCPGQDNILPDSDTLQRNTLKPIVKIMPFSARPQRYTKCVIKESDMMYTKAMNKQDATTTQIKVNKDSEDSLQVPVRVIMNNRTVTIFAGDSYDTHLETFNLLSSNFEMIKDKPECFNIKAADGRYARLCPFGCTSNSAVVDEWRYDFNLFKYQCNVGHKEQILDMDKKLKEKIRVAKSGLMDEIASENKRKAQRQEENKLVTRVQQINTIAVRAIEKEVNLEEMIKKEEQEREQREEEEINIRIAKEQEKQVNTHYNNL
jgi:hypothetical protein